MILAESSSTQAPTLDPKNATAIPLTFEDQIIAYSSLYSMAILCIIWGTARSLQFVRDQIERNELIETSITTKQAKRFPITASLVLFSLYLVFK